jgi:hypothetical protein
MAVYYFRNTGDVNWGTATNWSLTDGGGATGAVPTATDDAIFTNNSGNCTVNASGRVCLTLNFSTYTNTITMTNQIAVSGNVTLGAGMGIAGAGRLVLLATATLTSNGKIWPNELATGGSSIITFTLADDWVVSGALNLTNSSTTGAAQKNTFNGFTLSFGGSLTVFTNGNRDVGGTTKFIMNGTGNWTNGTSSSVRNSLDINTTGTFTFASAQINYSTGTLTYIAGTVITTGNNFVMQTSATLDTSGMTLNQVTAATGTHTLISDLNTNVLSIGAATFNGANINLKGNISITNNTGSAGTSTLIFNGTGNQTWSGGSFLRMKTTIDKPSGTLFLTGTIQFNGNTLTYISGEVIQTGVLSISNAATTLDTNSLVFNTVNILNNIAVTLLSDLNIAGALGLNGIVTINGAGRKVNIGGSFSNSNTGATPQGGTADIVMVGTGIIASAGIPFSFNLEINTDGVVSISGTVRFRDDTFKLTKGTLSATSTGVLLLTANCTLLGMHKASLPTISVTAGITVTMNEFFSGTPTKSVNVSSATANSTYTIAFQDGFEKITKFVNVSDCTLLRPLQLLMLTNNSLVRCTGIRMNNQSPNGVAKNNPSVNQSMSYSANLLTSDPAIN